jgi:hypothetical protein
MQLRHFVSVSAVVLAAWLAVTFVYEVPSQRYPKLDKYPKTAVILEKASSAAPVVGEKSSVAGVSASR